MRRRGSIEERLASAIDKSGDCWIWTAKTPTVAYEGRSTTPRRVMYMMNIGEIPNGKIVSVICGQDRCVRPEHLLVVAERNPIPLLERRFWRRVDKSGDCWLWTGTKTINGYGSLRVGASRNTAAHRFAWELANGPIPEGMYICHHCDVRNCVRLDHLFLGDHDANMADMARKGRHVSPNAQKESCARGHEYDERNTRRDAQGGRHCRTCQREDATVKREALRAGTWVPKGRELKPTCRYGHPFSPENTYYRPGGSRMCIACRIPENRVRIGDPDIK